MNFRRYLAIILIVPCLLITSIRVGYYLINYASIQSFKQDLVASVIFNNPNFSSSEAIKILRSSNPSDGVITFRQADLIHSIDNPWLDNFDPRFAELIEIKSAEKLHATLIKSGYKYIHVPPYTWPTIYRTAFQDLLADPRYSVPLVPNVGSYSGVIDKAQLFELNSSAQKMPRETSCAYENPKNFKLLVGKIGLGQRILSILTGIPIPEEISDVKKRNVSSSPMGYWLGASNYVQLDGGKSSFFPRSSNQLPKNFESYSVELVLRGKGLVYVDAIGFPVEAKMRNLVSSGQELSRVYERNLDSLENRTLAFQFRVQNEVETVRFRISSFNKYSDIKVYSFKVCGHGKLHRQNQAISDSKLNLTVKTLIDSYESNCSFEMNFCRIDAPRREMDGFQHNQEKRILGIACNSIDRMGIDRAYQIFCKFALTIPSQYLTLAKVQCTGNCLNEKYTLHGIDPSGFSRKIPIIFEGDHKKSFGFNFLPTGKWTSLSLTAESIEDDGTLGVEKSITVTEVFKHGK